MMLSPRRLFFGTSTALVLVAFVATVVSSRASGTMSVRNRAAVASARVDSTLAMGNGATRAIALAYLERTRLGLGSPYRLIEQAARDPRLGDSLRSDVAWAIVGRVLDGEIYDVDPRALDVIALPGMGAGHLEIIREAISRTRNPRVAEASVRVAYGLAASNGTTSMTSLPVVAEVAAQARDRVLAIRDLREAIRRSEDDDVDLVEEIVLLRSLRELDVERPLLIPLTPSEREDAIDGASEILRRIAMVTRGAADSMAIYPGLDEKAAMELARVAQRLPPIAATRVIVAARTGTLRSDSTLGRDAIGVIGSAANEESLVAGYAYANRLSGGRSAALQRLMVSAGVALRAHAQDRVWFPGEPAAGVGAVIGRFGLKTIAFDAGIPVAWKPYYAHVIASALEDFTRAVPGYDPAGLSFRIEMGALPDSALAMHDPRTHTIRMSAMTPGGTLAHELAHDVDWQAGRRLFARSGGYATDRSVREGAIRLSSSMRGLASARMAGRGRVSSQGSSRPAEVFARSVDWFVADALAAMGRSNGHLSAIEDPLLSGFAATPGDAASLEAASSLVHGLAEMTWMPDSLASDYVRRWQSLDQLDPSTIVLRMADAPMSMRRGARPVFGVSQSMMTDLATGMLCRMEVLRSGTAQERLIAMAIDARARGIVVRRARYSSPAMRPAWAQAALGAVPYHPAAADEILRRTTAAVAEGAARAGLIELAPAPFRPGCD
jgi:hypothetical protein